MKKLNELKVDDILYAIDKHSLAYILEFRVIEIEDDKLFVDTKYLVLCSILLLILVLL